MKRFLVLYRSSMSMSEMMGGTTPEQRQAGMEAWMAWMKEAGDALVDPGAPIGAGHQVNDGATSASKSDVTGYLIVQAESAENAAKLFERHPHFMTRAETSIVHEAMPTPGS